VETDDKAKANKLNEFYITSLEAIIKNIEKPNNTELIQNIVENSNRLEFERH
jgi:hypothetical protein